MWLLNYLPDVLFHLIFLIGILSMIASFALGFIPLISKYKLPIQIAALLLIIFGGYMEGSISQRKYWESKVAQVELELAKKEVESEKITVKIVTEYIDKIKIVKEKGDTIVKQVPIYITEKSDANCIISNSFVLLHDSASQNEIPNTSGIIDENPSEVKLSEVAETVSTNYTRYYELVEQVKALQKFIIEQEKLHNQ